MRQQDKAKSVQPSQGQKPPARAYGASASKPDVALPVTGQAISGKMADKPMYDPSARN